MGRILLLILFQIILIALNAVFASAEIAVLSVNETKLEHMANDGNHKAKRLFGLTREPAKFLATIQVAITLSGFLGSAFAADNFSGPLVNWVISLGVRLPYETLDTAAVVVITLILSYFTLVFGELVPKRLAMKKSEKIAMNISGPLKIISVMFKPLVWFLSASTNIVLRMLGIDPDEVEDEVSEEEIIMMVDAGSEKGTIDVQEQEFIRNVFEFNDITAGEIVTHRTDVSILWMEEMGARWDEIIHGSRHTLYPICDGSTDNIVGVLNAKDYFRLEEKSREKILSEAVYQPYFVPETIKADILFKNMKSSRHSMAVVLDEYGGMEGIVTLYDLIEEIVGELNDEPVSETNEPYIKRIGKSSWLIYGNITLEEIEKEMGCEIKTDEYDTVTGMVFDYLGAIPDDGEKDISIQINNFNINIKKIFEHQISEAVIMYKEQCNSEENLDEE